MLYVLFNDKLTVIDPETLESRILANTSRFDLGWDGNLYLTDMQTNTILYRIEVDGEVTEEPPHLPVPVRNPGFEEGLAGWTPCLQREPVITMKSAPRRPSAGPRA
ncbi:hypothetical protein N6H14_22230 [Paenibacillus sp. CC-CFT747]|nr:hypothetical protein N6H14_22230 [Paenibacillus sp. CC-CFT747]